MENDATISTPVLKEYSPDANGRYGLLTCNETGNTHLKLDDPDIYIFGLFLLVISRLEMYIK